jgi:chromosome segregation ATPase
MPRINRIRIVNFSYNHDSRHILDETFNFHGGDNALLNLANGGGKSVLVQLFLQPVAPGVRIQGRNIASFFHKKKLPAYVMIEWKLDGAGGYLLTGIGIVSAEAPGAEEEKSRVKYFTFTSKYTGANAFDIAHIPLVSRNGGVLEVLPFREARDLMADKERKDPFAFGYFPSDDGDRYNRYLAEFGIAQDEWRNVIAKINDSEGGLEEIFQKYKNSGQLLNDWIIKTVEQAMFKNRSESRSLEEMLENLVREVVENERFIVEKELLDGFLATFREQVEDLSRLLQGLDEQKQLAGRLAALHGYLISELGSLREKHESNQREMEDCKAGEQRVNLEERSHNYWLRQAEYAKASEILHAAEAASSAAAEALQEARTRRQLMQAARLVEEINRKRSELSGIEEQLAAARKQYDTDDRVQSLEYSLKLLYEETLASVAAELSSLQEEKAAKESRLGQAGEDLQKIEGEKSSLDRDKGGLEERQKSFERFEKEARRKLDIIPRRNLLGEMEAASIQKTREALEKTRDDLERQAAKVEDDKAAGAARRQDIEHELKELQAAFAEEKTALSGVERDIREYEQKELEIKGLLNKYGFDFDCRFDRERMSAAFEQKVKELESRLEAAARVRDDAHESLAALKNGHLHTSEELAAVLAGLDIQYDTGEAYLRRLPPEARRTMLEGNPVLPYALIMSRADLDRVATAVDGMTLRRVIPFMTYEDLGVTVPVDGRLALAGDGIALACLYEGRMFDSESLVKLVAELEQKREAAFKEHTHFSDAHRAAVSDRAFCARFDYTRDYPYQLEKKKNACVKRLQELADKSANLEDEKKRLGIREKELERQGKKLQGDIQKAGGDAALFTEFMEKEPDYQDCRRRLAGVVQSITGLEAKRAQLAERQESLRKRISELEKHMWQKEREQAEAQAQYTLYQDAPEAARVEGDIAGLSIRLKALKEQYSGEIGLLEKRKEDLAADITGRQRELKELGLHEEAYAGVVYDEAAAGRLRDEITRLEGLLKETQLAEKAALKAEGAAEMALENALTEVKRLGAEAPLPPAEIRGDFGERRRKARLRVNELETENKQISERISNYESIRGKIEQLVDTAATIPAKDFMPGQDIAAQYEECAQDFDRLKKDNTKAADRLRIKYADLKTEYRGKNSTTDNIFKGLDPLLDKAGMEFDEFYYLYERMSLHGEKLTELITLYEVQLANLERNKKDLVQQSFLHGLRVYEEIQWISDNSRIRLQGRTRPVQMLKVDLQLDSKETALQRVAGYIEDCITQVRAKTRQEKGEDEARKIASRLMSSRELLNVLLGNPHIPVSVFKIDLNMQNSRLKPWEDAVRENSGGEKFVVFFSVLSALMTYTRARAMEAAGADADTGTRVLVMDNPFGPISSEHLLTPLFDIAKKHRTQLICLSDLKQNSIMNCFNLIFMLKVRTSAIGSNEYLKFEEYIRDDHAVQDDERLEKAVFRASDFKQVSLFD